LNVDVPFVLPGATFWPAALGLFIGVAEFDGDVVALDPLVCARALAAMTIDRAVATMIGFIGFLHIGVVG
jgi:hypothetical protein